MPNVMPNVMSATTPKNLWSLLQPTLQKYHRKPAWICRHRDDRRIVTYQQIHHAALTTADLLRQHGLKAGDTMCLTAPNGPEFTVAALAAWKIGANLAPIHLGNSDYEIALQLDALTPQILLKHKTTNESAGAMKTMRMEMEMIINMNMEKSINLSINMAGEAARIARETGRPANHTADSLAVRIYTSGSTGHPKVVRLSHGNLISNLLAAGRIGKFTTRDRFISLLPLSHAMGLMGNLLLPLYHGCAIVSPRVLAASEILETLQQENISVVIAVPRLYRNIMQGLEKKFKDGGRLAAAYRALLKLTPLTLRKRINAPIRKKLGGQIKAWVSGGSHLDSRISRYYHDLGLPLRQGYGLTETSPLTCIQENFTTARESVGKPIEKVRVKIHNPDEHGNGEVWISGPNVMLGYEDRCQTSATLQDGWFKSGDIGRLDAHGQLFLTGRSKRLIVTESGKNVYPEELETLLERDFAIKEAGVLEVNSKPVCVLAMADLDNIESINNMDALDKQTTIATARKTLAAFNQLVSAHNRITRFALVAELPRTALGKMALQELPAIFAQHEMTHLPKHSHSDKIANPSAPPPD